MFARASTRKGECRQREREAWAESEQTGQEALSWPAPDPRVNTGVLARNIAVLEALAKALRLDIQPRLAHEQESIVRGLRLRCLVIASHILDIVDVPAERGEHRLD